MGSDATMKEPVAVAGADQIYRLIYRSHSLLGPKDDAGLAEILKTARGNNAGLGVTGALMLYDDWFAQVLEGPQPVVEALFARIKSDARHNGVSLKEAGPAPKRLFGKWAMAVVAEHHQPDMPMVATTGGLAQGAPWKVTLEQEAVLTRLRDLTRGFGRGS
jgi:Sensors of blue-light using FAD